MKQAPQTYTNQDGKQYKVVEFLGKGQHSIVQKVIDDNEQIYVLKEQVEQKPIEKEFFDKIKSKDFGSQKFLDKFQIDFRIIQKLIDKDKSKEIRLLKIYDYFQFQGKFYVVQEYCNSGNLEKYIKKKGKLEIKEAQKILLQLSKQLKILHDMGYIYQDIKPTNIVINEINNKSKFYLCDFGSLIDIYYQINDRQLTQFPLRTPYYLAPESIDLANKLSSKIDIWALGVLYYELIQGKKLFDGKNQQQIFKQIKGQKFDEFPKNLKTILKLHKQNDKTLLFMFNPNPNNRPDIKEVVGYLQQQKYLFKIQKSEKIYNEKMLKLKQEAEQKLEYKQEQFQIEQEQIHNEFQLIIENENAQINKHQELKAQHNILSIDFKNILNKFQQQIQEQERIFKQSRKQLKTKYQQLVTTLNEELVQNDLRDMNKFYEKSQIEYEQLETEYQQLSNQFLLKIKNQDRTLNQQSQCLVTAFKKELQEKQEKDYALQQVKIKLQQISVLYQIYQLNTSKFA